MGQREGDNFLIKEFPRDPPYKEKKIAITALQNVGGKK